MLQRREYDVLQSEGVREALDELDPRSRRIVEARWLNEDQDGKVGTSTLHDLAQEFGVSAERIRQIEAKALAEDAKRFGGVRVSTRLTERTVASGWLVEARSASVLPPLLR